ncbi:MAG: alpha-ketoacid dehydrogenase subunit beta, partial [Alphaproteobacteria bacterium]|nr:alpha-ketoacid dehydrogenase subunit beta [Alphaproteobacteria bacterium]
TRGRFTCPMVLRAPFGGGIHAPEHHSESTEALFAHMPGLRVVIPSTPQQAYGLLLASIWDPDPVVFLEPKRIYRAPKEQIDDDGKALPLDKCFFLKEGSDVTFVTWGAMTVEVLEAAMLLESEGISAEVITPGTIKPMDMETILQSVEKTGRCVIIHEAALTGGVGAEIAAQLAEKALLSLLAPVQRVAGYDTVMPLPKLEKLYIPSAERIVEAARKVIEYT